MNNLLLEQIQNRTIKTVTNSKERLLSNKIGTNKIKVSKQMSKLKVYRIYSFLENFLLFKIENPNLCKSIESIYVCDDIIIEKISLINDEEYLNCYDEYLNGLNFFLVLFTYEYYDNISFIYNTKFKYLSYIHVILTNYVNIIDVIVKRMNVPYKTSLDRRIYTSLSLILTMIIIYLMQVSENSILSYKHYYEKIKKRLIYKLHDCQLVVKIYTSFKRFINEQDFYSACILSYLMLTISKLSIFLYFDEVNQSEYEEFDYEFNNKTHINSSKSNYFLWYLIYQLDIIYDNDNEYIRNSKFGKFSILTNTYISILQKSLFDIFINDENIEILFNTEDWLSFKYNEELRKDDLLSFKLYLKNLLNENGNYFVKVSIQLLNKYSIDCE